MRKELPMYQYPHLEESEHNPMLKVEEVMEIFYIGRNSAYKLVHQPGFPSIHIGKSIRVPYKELMKWISENALSDEPP